MKGSRVTVGGGMALVALVAVDCLALRWSNVRGSRSNLLILGLLPVLVVLCVGAWLGGRDLFERRRCSSTVVGFQAFGAMAMDAITTPLSGHRNSALSQSPRPAQNAARPSARRLPVL